MAPHCQVSNLLPIGCLIVVCDQAYHSHVVSKLNDGVEVMHDHTVVGEQRVQEGTKHTPLRVPVFKISMEDVLMPSGFSFRRELFSPRDFSLGRSFEGTMGLNAELSSMNSILT